MTGGGGGRVKACFRYVSTEIADKRDLFALDDDDANKIVVLKRIRHSFRCAFTNSIRENDELSLPSLCRSRPVRRRVNSYEITL